MIATTDRIEMAHALCLPEGAPRQPADVSTQADDEAYPVEAMPVGEPRPQSK
jgi:hypothetical protein